MNDLNGHWIIPWQFTFGIQNFQQRLGMAPIVAILALSLLRSGFLGWGKAKIRVAPWWEVNPMVCLSRWLRFLIGRQWI